MTTTSINDTLVQLEKLHKAYSDILEQAKEQLESLTLSDQDAATLARRLSTIDIFRNTIVSCLYDMLKSDAQSLTSEEFLDMYDARAFVRVVADRILDLSKDEISQFVNQEVRKIVESRAIETVIERRINEHDAIKHALALQKFVAESLALKIEAGSDDN